MPGKKGIGLVLKVKSNQPDESTLQLNLKRILALQLSWNYSWNSVRVPEQSPCTEFVPMIWGARGGGEGEAGIRQKIEHDVIPQYKSGLVHRLLAFNEPDVKTQSNLSVDQVISYWPILQESGIPLASPSAGHALGDWMQQFMTKVKSNGLRVDYVAMHWYKNPNPERFKSDIMEVYHRYGKRPILVTEFAPADWTACTSNENKYTPQQVLAFAKEVLPWLERQKFVEGYAWFPFRPSSAAGTSSALFVEDYSETLTALGRYYASVTPSTPDGDQSIE